MSCATAHPPPSLNEGTDADLGAAYLQIVPLFLLNFVVKRDKFTHFCPIFSTFVPNFYDKYENKPFEDIGHIESVVAECIVQQG